MKKLLFIFVLFYSFLVFANHVEEKYFLNETKAPCIYQTEYGESCKTCDAPESFRIIKSMRFLPCEVGKKCPEPVLADEKACPQRQLICDENSSYCYSILKECPKNFPLNSGGGCYSCAKEGMIWVKSKSNCDICPNRKVIKKGENLYCIFKNPPDIDKAPQNKPLVLKYGYKSCGYCVNEDEIADCSKCLDDYNIVNGKCKRKPERACFQA